MPCCAAVGCFINHEKKLPGIYFHRFPVDLELRFKWVLAMHCPDFIPTSYSRICSRHFTEDDYIDEKLGQGLLKKDAIPSVFDFYPEKKSKEIKASIKIVENIGDNVAKAVNPSKTAFSPFLVTIKRCDILSKSDNPETCNSDDNANVGECSRAALKHKLVESTPEERTSPSREAGDQTCSASVPKSCSFQGTSPVIYGKPLNVANQLQNAGLIKKSLYIRTDLLSDSQNKIPVYRPALDIEECEKVLNTPLFQWKKKKRFIGQYKKEEITTPEMKNLYEVAKIKIESQQKEISRLRKNQSRMKKRMEVLKKRIGQIRKGKYIEDTLSVTCDESTFEDDDDDDGSISCASKCSSET